LIFIRVVRVFIDAPLAEKPYSHPDDRCPSAVIPLILLYFPDWHAACLIVFVILIITKQG
jgi:hypothetical protein